jgi:DNA-directed RNA polymerase subunit RPC12/RpoP
MKCESCSAEISSKMRGALKKNTCPFCAEKIMAPMKAEQYANLLDVLDQTSFTNRSDIDTQIREKVAGLLMTNFVFKKLDLPKVAPDVIVIDNNLPIPGTTTVNVPNPTSISDTITVVNVPNSASDITTVVNTPNLTSTSAVDVNTASTRSIGETKAAPKPLKPQGTPKPSLTPSEYAKLQDETYNDDNYSDNEDFDSPTLSDLEGLTPEEIMRTFPDLTMEEIASMKEQATNAIKHRHAPSQRTSSSGNGIKRLK